MNLFKKKIQDQVFAEEETPTVQKEIARKENATSTPRTNAKRKLDACMKPFSPGIKYNAGQHSVGACIQSKSDPSNIKRAKVGL